jgi:polyisoprenoid-binding protein YceI
VNSSKLISTIFYLSIAIGLASCAATLSAPQARTPASAGSTEQINLSTIYSDLKKSGGKVISLDPKASDVRILVFRGGRAGKAGHNHVLSAPQFTGYLHLPAGVADSDARFDLEFRLDQLEIDNASHRASLGSAFATAMLPDAIEGTRRNMLGERNMDAARFPFVRIRSLQISGEAPKFAANIEIEMHGQKRQMWVPLGVEDLPDQVTVAGAFVLRQTDFGIKPFTALGGLLAVVDEVVVEFKLRGPRL